MKIFKKAGAIILAIFLIPVLALIGIGCLFSEKLRLRVLYEIVKAVTWFENRNYEPDQQLPYFLVADKLEHISVHTFIQCDVHENYKELLIDGTYIEEAVIGAWNQISMLYADAIGGDKHKYYTRLKKDMAKASLRLKWIYTVCEALSYHNDPKLVKILKRYGYNRPFTDKTLSEDIEWVLKSESRTQRVYDESVKEIEKVFGNTGKKTESEYYKVIAQIRTFANYQDSPEILARKWSMATYCLELNRWNSDVTAKNKAYQDLTSNNGKKV